MPVTVSGNVPRRLCSPVVATVSVDAPEPPLMLAGAKEAVVPAGSPVTLSATAPVKPSIAPADTVKAAGAPATTVRVAGVAVSVKSGRCTTSVTGAVCVKAPLVPVMVSGNVPAGVSAVVATVSVERRTRR